MRTFFIFYTIIDLGCHHNSPVIWKSTKITMDQEEIAATWSGNLASCESLLAFFLIQITWIKIEHHCIKSTNYPYLNHHKSSYQKKSRTFFVFFLFPLSWHPWPWKIGVTKLRWPKLAHNFNASMPQSANSLDTSRDWSGWKIIFITRMPIIYTNGKSIITIHMG